VSIDEASVRTGDVSIGAGRDIDDDLSITFHLPGDNYRAGILLSGDCLLCTTRGELLF
jgi:hypothetical protein